LIGKEPSVAIDRFSGETLYFWIGPGKKESNFLASGSRYTLIKNTGCPRWVENMSKSKSKSKKKVAKKAKVTKPADVSEIPVDGEAEDEMSAGEKFLMASKPYWAHILLGVLTVILGSVLWTAWGNMQKEGASQQWRELNNALTQAGLTNDVSSLKEMAGNFDGQAAGNWALQFAGDNEVNRGISMLARDRVGGMKLIKQGVESLQKVVDAPDTSKSPMLKRRSLFLLGYAKEALGEFDAAKGHYQAVLDGDEDSPFADVATRGLARVSNPELVAIYDKFRNWEESTDVAPGPLVPDAPKLDLEGITLPEGESDTFSSGGDFGGAEMKEDKASEDKASEEETKPVAEDKEESVADEAAMPKPEGEPKVEPTDVEKAEPTAEVEAPKESPAAEEAEVPATPAAEEAAPETGGEPAEAGGGK
jgi:predicted negative regulator of RcsB-dependent stress response